MVWVFVFGDARYAGSFPWRHVPPLGTGTRHPVPLRRTDRRRTAVRVELG